MLLIELHRKTKMEIRDFVHDIEYIIHAIV